MSKASELIANIDNKYKAELQSIEGQLNRDIERTSVTISDSLNERANITKNAILKADKQVSQAIQDSTQQINSKVEAYQTSIESLLSIADQKTQKKLSTTSLILLGVVAILIIGVSALTWICKSKYQEMQALDNQLIEKQQVINHLNNSGAKIKFSTCGQTRRPCLMVNKTLGTFGANADYMIPMGY